MKRLLFSVIAATFTYGCALAPLPAEENCGIQIPPKDAYPSYDGVYFTFTYPKVPPENYTGCWTTYMENGTITNIIHFESGKPSRYESYDTDGSLFASCRISRIWPGSPYSQCPSYEGVIYSADVIRHSKPLDREVPPGRDPRGKEPRTIPDYVIQDLTSIQDLQGENCKLQYPPKDAYPYFIVDNYFDFVYPNAITPDYTGCQMMWGKQITNLLVLHFEHGNPNIILKYRDNKLVGACKITDVNVEYGSECPDYKLFDFLAKEIGPFNGQVPEGLDLRR